MNTRIPELLQKHNADILSQWVQEQSKIGSDKISAAELKSQTAEFLKLFGEAIGKDDSRTDTSTWEPVKKMLADTSRSRGLQGFSPSETATFVFSIKAPLFALLKRELKTSDELGKEITTVSNLIDQLGLFTTEIYQKTRDEIILRQQEEMLELSTPVVKLWDGILALPMIGTLDSSRTQVVMESLLQKIMESGSEIAIIDITGVPTVDTLVAQHLIKTVTAARLMGAECIISGIRPQIAATIVHLGVDLGNVITKATLADAFGIALAKVGRTVVKQSVLAHAKDKKA